jgi:P27 family predicted phage terminase small subunit
VKQLEGMGILSETDRDAIAVYSQSYGRWEEAEEFLQKHGTVYPVRDAEGNVERMAVFPQVHIARHLLQAVKAYQQELGMTPSARSGLAAVRRPFESDLDRLNRLARQAEQRDPGDPT